MFSHAPLGQPLVGLLIRLPSSIGNLRGICSRRRRLRHHPCAPKLRPSVILDDAPFGSPVLAGSLWSLPSIFWELESSRVTRSRLVPTAR